MEKFIKSLIMDQPDKSIGYDTYIQHALYNEEGGYYQREGVKVGKEGDFYTSSMIHAIFAHMFADYFVKVSHASNIPLAICEIGAGDGTFAQQVMERLDKYETSYTYHLIEQSPYHRQKILEKQLDEVYLYESTANFHTMHPTFRGIVFSNELLDAHPVKVVENKSGELVEIRISLNEEGGFIEVPRACKKELAAFMKTYEIHLEVGQRIELPVYMQRMVKEMDHLLQAGMVVTVDYGYQREEWRHPARKDGSLRGYANHQLKNNILQNPGTMDITHHVHWDVWRQMGERAGWVNVLLMKQREFLLRSGILEELITHSNMDPLSEENRKNRAIRSLIVGDGLSEAFDVCIQLKNIKEDDLSTLHKH